jgi:hypothetical protein
VELLPFVDAHEVTVAGTAESVWQRLLDVVARSAMLGPRGFPVRSADRPRRLRLAGAHLFAAYDLTFDLEPAGDGETRIRASTHARFEPGPGQLYRAIVIGTGAHAWIVRRFLRALRTEQ